MAGLWAMLQFGDWQDCKLQLCTATVLMILAEPLLDCPANEQLGLACFGRVYVATEHATSLVCN
jgi:hypothetical protein